MNPKVYDVRECIRRIDKKNPASAAVKGTIYFPDWNGVNDHIQGIAPINGVDWDTGCVSGSTTDKDPKGHRDDYTFGIYIWS
jgi:hypothetical protein